MSGAAVILAALIVFDLILLGLFNRGQANDLDRALAARANAAQTAVATQSFPPSAPLAVNDLRHDDNVADIFLELFDDAGKPLSSTGAIDGAPPAITLADLARSAAANAPITVTAAGMKLRVAARAWSRADLGQRGYVLAGQPADRLARQRGGFAVLLVVSSLFILLAAGVASWWAAGRALKPLKAMASAADRIGETPDLSERLPEPRRQDELGRLTASFNRGLARVQASQRELTTTIETQQRFVADASHELRTPLTTIRANAGFLIARPDAMPADRDAALQDIAEESERMSRLVEDLLALARADAGQRLDRAPLDLRELVAEVVRQARRLHSARDVRLNEPGHPGALLLEGNADALKQLLWILIDNAAKHTQRGGLIEISLGFDQGAARITVRDDGPGLPEGEFERVFERFVQVDRARAAAGAGLGLAIARWIVEQHRGRIVAANDPNGGALFTVDLPVAAPTVDTASPIS